MTRLFAPAAAASTTTLTGTADVGARTSELSDGGSDSRITWAEADSEGEARIDGTDANGHGRRNLPETTGAASPRPEWRLAKRFETLGTNGDCAVARAEFDDGAAGRFARLDGDGALLWDEIASGSGGIG